MAFVATVSTNGAETEIGVCRYAESELDNVREMAITIADSWKHKGLAQLLLKRLIDYARGHGVTQLYSVNLVDDEAMAEIATEFGMAKKPDADDASQIVYSMNI
jgi:GNAT superfamily N-acetyltransferase